MKQPQVRERDLVNAVLAASAMLLGWQTCEVCEESHHLEMLEAGAEKLVKLVKRFRKEQAQ